MKKIVYSLCSVYSLWLRLRTMTNMTNSPKIKGKAAVKTALIQSASLLFAQRGIAGVSIREIAQHAQVNHGLVHRHFGSKEGLVQAVLDYLSQNVHHQLNLHSHSQPDSDTSPDSFTELLKGIFQNTETMGLHWRVLSHALLEGMDPDRLQNDFPVFRRRDRRPRPRPTS